MPPRSREALDAARRSLTLRGASNERRRRLTHRLVPAVLAVAVVSLVLGIVIGAGQSQSERTARDFAAAWARSNYTAMYGMLSPAAHKRVSSADFATFYRNAAATSTSVRLEPGRAKDKGDVVRVPVRVSTRVFGTIAGRVDIPVGDSGIDWRPELVFPGLRSGEQLTRRTTPPPRAKILARGGATIVSGPARSRTAGGGSASAIAGSMGAATTAVDRAALFSRGFPAGYPVGLSGLERALEPQVEGRPGGVLMAGNRTLASTRPVAARPVRSTIDLRLEAAADQALAGRFGGIAAIEPRTGKIRALAGIAFSAPQPPGSTFKMVTATAALENRLVKPTTPFPVETKAIVDGVGLENANGESCGGSFAASFANSCNSVFAPLGVRIGAKRLVDTAQRFGFNEQPKITGAAVSTIPPASQINTPLAVGSTAIGQGKVLATPLEMAVIASTIANRGLRREPTLLEDAPRTPPKRVTSRRVAKLVEQLMVGVVAYGTGTAAAIPGVRVAGKTGTAELKTTVGPTAENPQPSDQNANPGSDTDAWFAAYAPTKRPKIAVGALFVKAGAGGATAAPAARVVLASALGR
jgi:peptidoglycan glycosyltransferase